MNLSLNTNICSNITIHNKNIQTSLYLAQTSIANDAIGNFYS